MSVLRSVVCRSLLCGVLALQFACSQDPSGSEPRREGPPLARVQLFDPPETAAGPTLDEVFAEISKTAPSFAGVFTDADGKLVIQMADTLEAVAARTSVQNFFGGTVALQQHGSRVNGVRYSFSQLQAWLRAILQEDVPSGLRTSDIDERANAVRFGVADASTTEFLRLRAKSAQVPVDALIIEEVPPLVKATDYLTSRMRPVLGGLTIITTHTGCSLGFKAKIGTPRYLVTNAHCTSTFGADDNDQVGQPYLNSGYYVGTEYSDPGFTSGGSCPSGHTCRYSDAVLFSCDTVGVCSDYTIARTTSEYTGSDWGQSGSSQLTAEPWYVTAELADASLTQGTSVSRVGQAKGWTGGTIEYTCITQYNAGGQDKDLLCQYKATFVSASGDSGSPVFTYNASLGTASLAGIMHSYGGGYSIFSTISGVKTDLGAMTVWSDVY
jgi:hypothetical protein